MVGVLSGVSRRDGWGCCFVFRASVGAFRSAAIKLVCLLLVSVSTGLLVACVFAGLLHSVDGYAVINPLLALWVLPSSLSSPYRVAPLAGEDVVYSCLSLDGVW